MMMNVRVWLSALLISLAMGITTGSAGVAQECPKGLKPAGEFRLFFGLADGNGKTVTEDEWQQFLADTITPRFRAGLTVLEGRGQWLEASGSLQREPVKVVVGAIASDMDQSMKLVDEISAEFEARSCVSNVEFSLRRHIPTVGTVLPTNVRGLWTVDRRAPSTPIGSTSC